MKIGFVSRVSEFPESEWEGEFKTASEQKINHLELIINYPYFGPLTCTDNQINKLKELSERFSIELGFHLLPDYSMLDNELKDKKFDIASRDEETRKFSIEEIARTLEIAKKLNAKYIVIHGGKSKSEKEYNDHLIIARKSLEELNPLFGEIKLLVENLPTKFRHIQLRSLPRSPEDILSLVDGLDNIGICLDIGHANTFGDPIEFYEKISKSGKVIDMHIHDNKGDSDTHTPIGKGNIDFEKFLKKLKDDKYQGHFSIELDTWVEPPKSMEKDQRIETLKKFRELL